MARDRERLATESKRRRRRRRDFEQHAMLFCRDERRDESRNKRRRARRLDACRVHERKPFMVYVYALYRDGKMEKEREEGRLKGFNVMRDSLTLGE